MESKFEFAKELIKKAGQYILDHMQEDLCVETKSSPTDLVTRLDKEVQELLVGEILSRYPEDKICAEEGCLRASVQEGKVEAQKLLDSYKGFKAVVPSKSEEKRLGREFETVSGYSLYRAVQAAKEKGEGKISLGK